MPIIQKQLTALALSMLALALMSGCTQEAEEQAPVVRPIKIMTIDGSPAGRSVQYSGTIQAGEFAEMSFEIPGRIVELPVNEGQAINQGDLLARIDPADYQSRVDQAQANYDAMQSAFKRYATLVEKGTISRQDFDLQKRNFEVAEANLNTAQKALGNTRLLAPFSGNIGLLYVRSFVNIQAKEPILILQNTSSLDVVMSIPEQDWSRSRPDERPEDVMDRVTAYVTVSTFPGRQIPATLKEVAKVADPVTRTFEAKVTIERPVELNLLPGMTATVHIVINGTDDPVTMGAIMLPVSAVLADDTGAPSVWIVEEDTMIVNRRAVTVADMADSQIRVMSGLEPGDRVAISGVSNLRESMQVRELDPE